MKKVLFFSLAIISFQGFSETAEDLVSKMWASFKDSDLEMFSETMSKTSTMVTFGTDASERWEGWDALKASVKIQFDAFDVQNINSCLLYTSPSPRDRFLSRMPSSA